MEGFPIGKKLQGEKVKKPIKRQEKNSSQLGKPWDCRAFDWDLEDKIQVIFRYLFPPKSDYFLDLSRHVLGAYETPSLHVCLESPSLSSFSYLF